MLTDDKNKVHEFLSNKSSLILFLILVGIGILVLFGQQRKERDVVNINTPRTNHSTSSGQLSYHHNEFNIIALGPNQTYEIVFDESGESGLIDMTGSANPVKHYSIETTEGCTVRYTTGQLAYIPPERTGVDVKLPVIIRRNLQFRIKNTEDRNSIIITISG